MTLEQFHFYMGFVGELTVVCYIAIGIVILAEIEEGYYRDRKEE